MKRGAFPQDAKSFPQDAKSFASDYLVRVACSTAKSERIVESRPRSVIFALVRRACVIYSAEDVARDVRILEQDERISSISVRKCLDILAKNFLFDPIPPFSRHLRSAPKIGSMRKMRPFAPGFAYAALRERSPRDLMTDMNTMGFLFESLCLRDLKVYAQTFGGKVSHYREYDGKEIDAIVSCPGCRWGAFDIN